MIAFTTRARTLSLGLGFVLALVVAMPLALALVPADTLRSDVGGGAGSGDLSAAALSSLNQDLQTQRVLPRAAEAPGRAYLVHPALTGFHRVGPVLQRNGFPSGEPPPASCTAGTTDAPHPLLL